MNEASAALDIHRRTLRTSARTRDPVLHGDVGALQLLRHARLLVLFMVEQIERRARARAIKPRPRSTGCIPLSLISCALPGGWIADRLWGAQRAVWVGGLIIMCGHFVLAVPGVPAFFLGSMLVCSAPAC